MASEEFGKNLTATDGTLATRGLVGNRTINAGRNITSEAQNEGEKKEKSEEAVEDHYVK